MRKAILLFSSFFLTWQSAILGQNIMLISDYSGDAYDTITVAVEIENIDEFVGFQFDLPLPDAIDYLEASAALTGRANGHNLAAILLGNNTLRIISYSMNQLPFNGNSGSVVDFQLVLGSNPGYYALELENAIIANAQSQNILTGVQNGNLTILAPNISANPNSLNFGEVPLSQFQDMTFTIYNTGNTILNVTRISTDHDDFVILSDTSYVVNLGNSVDNTIRFYANTKGAFDQNAFVESDDPDEASIQISLNAYAFAVNELDVNDTFGRSGYSTTLTLDICNMERFVGFQFNLLLPSVMNYTQNSVNLTSRATNHVVLASYSSSNTLTVVAYSPTNANFLGTEGDVIELTFNLDGQGGFYNIDLHDPIIADSTGSNIISDYFSGQLEIISPDIWVNPTSFDFGLISILDTNSIDLEIGNNGSDTLFFSEFTFSNEVFFGDFSGISQIMIGNSINIPLYFHSDEEGSCNGALTIRSNDPNEDPLNINLTGETFIPNKMILNDVEVLYGDTTEGSLAVENYEPFVAFQCDVLFPEGVQYVDGSAQLTSRAVDHQLIAAMTGDDNLQLIAYSLTQSEFLGNTGNVATFDLIALGDIGTHDCLISDAILGNAQLENILAEIQNGEIEILPNPPQAFELLEPLNGDTLDTDSLTLGWTASFDPDPNDTMAYQVEWSTDPAFTAPNISTVTAASCTLTSISDDETYYWRVKAVDSFGLYTWANGDSGGWLFSLNVAESPESFTLTSPAWGDTCWTMNASLEWNSTSDPDPYDIPQYDVWLDTFPDFFTAWQVADSLSDPSCTLIDLLHDHLYYWTVRATDSNTPGTWAADTSMFRADNLMLSEIFLPAGWHLLSIPRKPENLSLDAIFGDDITGVYFAYTFTSSTGYSLIDSVEFGKGLWLLTVDSALVDIEGTVVTDSTVVDLFMGWTLAGTGWFSDYPLDSLKFSDGNEVVNFSEAVNSSWISPVLYSYDNYAASYSIADCLTPWSGYWIYALVDNLQMITCPLQFDNNRISTAGSYASGKAEDDDFADWSVPIILQQGGIIDDISSFGMHSEATDSYDPWHDFPSPPIPPSGDYLRAVFEHPEWNSPVGDDFCTDVRALFENETRYRWTFVIEAADTGWVTVSFDNLRENLPAGCFAIATHDNHSVDLLKKSSINFYYNTPYEISVELIQDTIAGDDAQTMNDSKFGGNYVGIYPNPFNSETTIRIKLSDSSILKVGVYNILGKQVATLANGTVSSGWHNLVFRTPGLPTGIYFVKVEAPGKIEKLSKIVLLK